MWPRQRPAEERQLLEISDNVLNRRYYQALKLTRRLIAYEQEVIRNVTQRKCKHIETPSTVTMSDREIDAYALTQCAFKLQECQKNWDMPEQERIDRLFEALKINGLLWSIFQAEILADGNPLPRKLRRRSFEPEPVC